jgi:hypothetical protein
VRLFRRLLLWVPRKNGKSEFLAALALLFWALDGIVGGQGYVFARDEDQAELPFNKMKAMVGYNPELAASIQSHKKSLYLKECATAFQLLTGAEEGKHGKGANVILGDEMHEWKSRKIETDLRGGTGTRLEPIELYASTAGLKTNLTGVELWDESLAILEGRVEEPTTLVALFAAEPEDDWRDEKVWARANPSLGLSPTVQFLRREARLAEGNPRREATFRCYHLNQWVESTGQVAAHCQVGCLRADREAGAIGKGSRAAAVSAVSTFRRPAISPPWCGCSSRCRVRKNGRSGAGFGCPRTRSRSASRMPATRCRSTAGTTSAHSRPRPAIMSTRVCERRSSRVSSASRSTRWRSTLEREQAARRPANRGRRCRANARGEAGHPFSMGEPSKHFERLVFAGLIDHGGHPLLQVDGRQHRAEV